MTPEQRECEILMLKVRYCMTADWEFKRLLVYLSERPAALEAAGKKILADGIEKLL